jgi:hypothetical protein
MPWQAAFCSSFFPPRLCNVRLPLLAARDRRRQQARSLFVHVGSYTNLLGRTRSPTRRAQEDDRSGRAPARNRRYVHRCQATRAAGGAVVSVSQPTRQSPSNQYREKASIRFEEYSVVLLHRKHTRLLANNIQCGEATERIRREQRITMDCDGGVVEMGA